MADIQDIYSRLLGQRYQETLFADLKIHHREKGDRETLSACPFCGKPDHFSYSSEEPVYHCWHCGASGDWIKYLIDSRQVADFREALGLLAKAAGVDLPQYDQGAYQAYIKRADILEAAQRLFVQELLDAANSQAVWDYLDQRGYSLDEIDQMGLGAYVSRDRLQQELLKQGYTEQEIREAGLYTRGLGDTHCLTMLWRDSLNRAIGIVGRALQPDVKPKYLYSAGMAKDQGLIGLTRARGSKQVILTEGVLDALLINTKGLEAPAVATGGTSLSDAQVKMLEASGCQELLLALDADKAGQDATERILLQLQGSGLRAYVVSLPAGYKDPDELIRHRGQGGLLDPEALSKASSGQRFEQGDLLIPSPGGVPQSKEGRPVLDIQEQDGLYYYRLDDPQTRTYWPETQLLTEAEVQGMLEPADGLALFAKALEQAERWPKWMARRIVGRQDLSTDRGLDQAVYDALELWSSLQDAILRRDFVDALKAATRLSDEDLLLRSQQQSQRAAQERQERALSNTANRIRDAVQAGDVLRGQQELEQGLDEIRRARGVQGPEPYLLEDFTQDILTVRDGLQTGWPSVDEILSIPQGAISIVAGRPGHGKTTLQLNLLIQLLQRYPDRAFYFYSYEEAKRNLALKLIMILAGTLDSKEAFLSLKFNQGAYVNYLKDKRGTNKAIEQALATYQSWTSSGRLWISDAGLPGEDLAAVISQTARAGNVGAVLIDYIQRIPLREQLRTGQRYLEIKRVSELLLEQAIRQDLPIILGAQFNRAGVAQRGVPPRLDNLRESGDIEQDANLVIGLYNKAVEDAEEAGQASQRIAEIQLEVLKQRGGVQGARAYLTFDKPLLRLTDAGKSSSGSTY
jgi:DNA primase catalytic core